MHRALVAIALVLAVALPGCLSDLTAPDHEFATLAEVYRPFSYTEVVDPTAPPGSQDEAYATYLSSFVVPEGSLQVTVDHDVFFQKAPGEVGAPEQFQEVQVRLIGPGGAELRAATYTADGGDRWAMEEPAAGTYDIQVRARGQGFVNLQVFGFVPVSE